MLALGLVALVVSQAEVPAACLQASVTEGVTAAQKRILASGDQLMAIINSGRKDIPQDREAINDFVMYTTDLFDIAIHFSDLAATGALSTDKETKHRVRKRLVYVLQVIQQRISNLDASLKRNGPYVTLPMLANEMKELRSVMAALEGSLSGCINAE